MARYRITRPQYPQTYEQWAITTPSGIMSKVFDDEKLALERFKDCDPDWKLVKLTVMREDVTPEDHKGVMQLHMSQAIIEAAA